jgi:hypothetical protein
MAEARDRSAWNRTLALLAELFNVNRDPKKTKPIDPMQFFPWSQPRLEQAPPPTEEDREMLRHLFPGK